VFESTYETIALEMKDNIIAKFTFKEDDKVASYNRKY